MSYELIRESFPVARKRHRCIWCGEGINAGVKHRHEVSSFDGNLQDHRWHLECDDDAKDYFDEGNGPEFSAYSNERPKLETVGGRGA
jgi:hypothetical protein